MNVHVTVVGYHADPEALSWTLAALSGQSAPPECVHLHLNESSEAEVASVDLLLVDGGPGYEFTVTWSAENAGFCAAHNRLLAAAFGAGAELAVVLNPDLALAPDALSALAAAVDPAVARLYGPALELADPVTRTATGRVDTVGIVWASGGRHLDDGQGSLVDAHGGGLRAVAGISGACLAVSRAAYDALLTATGEFFDEEFFAYREDAELAFRAALIGVPSMLVPAATGLHVRSLRANVRGRSAHIDRLGVRNRFLIAFKYGRHRPGGVVGPLLRDLVVVGGVLLRERSSLAGLFEAWRLRATMRAKGRRVLAQAVMSSREACAPRVAP